MSEKEWTKDPLRAIKPRFKLGDRVRFPGMTAVYTVEKDAELKDGKFLYALRQEFPPYTGVEAYEHAVEPAPPKVLGPTTMVYTAEGKFSAVYDLEAKDAGHYKGKATMYFGGRCFKAEAHGKGGERAIAMAVTKICADVLQSFKV
jgi:hypothetical protein